MKPTNKLRWLNREFGVCMNPGVFGPSHMGIEIRPVLQQLWIDTSDDLDWSPKAVTEWRDIEVVNES